MSGPCWAIVKDFAKLEFMLETGEVFAEADQGKTLLVQYIPMVNGDYGEIVNVQANRVDMAFAEPRELED